MSSRTCAYIASKNNPRSWHGTDPKEFWLDRDPEDGGLGISEWRCPHPPLGQEDGDEEYCVFHTNTDVPADHQRNKLLDALDHAGDSPWDDRPEHRGQFVGATFGAIDLSNEAIIATDDYDIRFDHTQFIAEDSDLNFEDTTFKTTGQKRISFGRTDFITNGSGDVLFNEATFDANGDGDVFFTGAKFETNGDGDVRFLRANFFVGPGDKGSVYFNSSAFRANGTGSVDLRNAKFISLGPGNLLFCYAAFRANGGGYVFFFFGIINWCEFFGSGFW
jgi:hypothetical protein